MSPEKMMDLLTKALSEDVTRTTNDLIRYVYLRDDHTGDMTPQELVDVLEAHADYIEKISLILLKPFSNEQLPNERTDG